MLFDPELFASPLFEEDGPVVIPPVPIFVVTRADSGTPFSFAAPIKDPDAIERHGMDWSAWLQEGDGIATFSVTADGAGLVIDEVAQSAGIVSWRLQDGMIGRNYIVTCRITTVSGLADERSVLYRVRNR
jgi:hypothetical protein